MIYKATCFDKVGGHHQAWVQDIIEEYYFNNHLLLYLVPRPDDDHLAGRNM
jgi:hypothetical protein